MDILKEYPLIDERGERYREFGRGCREYAPVLIVHEPAPAEPMPQKLKACPFQSGLYPRCTEDCSFYENGKCKPGTAQTGKRCPFPARLACGDTCAMYENGRCTLFCSRKERKNERV